MVNNVDYTGISICSGVGGLELGIKIALPTARILCCVEREAYAIGALSARMQDGWLDAAPIWPDLRTFDGKPWRGKVDFITGGYPCQPFSVAGKGKGKKDERWLWDDIKRIIDEVQPSVCFFENVARHLQVGFEQVADDLDRMGFGVASGVFSAEEVGAPHERKRLFIMAHHKSVRADRGMLKGCNISKEEGQGLAVEFAGSGETGVRGQGLGNAHGEEPRDGADSVAKRHLRGKEKREHSQTNKDGRREGARAGVRGGDLGNAPCVAEERPKRGRDSTGQPTGAIGDWGGHIFPPRPNGDWTGVKDELKPQIHRGADGMADWLDRLVATGNGVVPLCAAHAFITLSTAFTGEQPQNHGA